MACSIKLLFTMQYKGLFVCGVCFIYLPFHEVIKIQNSAGTQNEKWKSTFSLDHTTPNMEYPTTYHFMFVLTVYRHWKGMCTFKSVFPCDFLIPSVLFAVTNTLTRINKG